MAEVDSLKSLRVRCFFWTSQVTWTSLSIKKRKDSTNKSDEKERNVAVQWNENTHNINFQEKR